MAFYNGRELATVESRVADVAAGDEIDHILSDVGGVVAYAFEVFGNHNQLEGGKDNSRVLHHIGEKLAKELIAKAVYLIIALENGLGQILVATNESIEAVTHHTLGKFAHAGKINVRLDLGMADDADGRVRDVHCLIADALEVAIDAGDGEQEAQVSGHRGLKCEGALNALVDFNLHFIDGIFFSEDTFGEALVGIENGVDGLMDGAFGKAAHPEKALF